MKYNRNAQAFLERYNESFQADKLEMDDLETEIEVIKAIIMLANRRL